MTVTVAHLKKIANGSAPLAAVLVGPINASVAAYGIDKSPTLMRHFLAHMCVETDHFTRLVENLNYTTVKRLRQVWPSRFKTDAAAKPYVRNPKKLANFVYGGRLGNTGPDDGWLYRGAGPYQMTGKDNFGVFGKIAGVDLVNNPELARDPIIGVKVAAAFFVKRMAKAAAKDDIVGSTLALNGGRTGLVERREALTRAKTISFGSTAKPLALVGDVQDASVEDDEEVAAIEPEPEPANIVVASPAVDLDEEETRALQVKFRELGYHEVGIPNGKFDTKTAAAVSAFQKNEGLPVTGGADEETLQRLSVAKPRKVSETRQNLPVQTIREKMPSILATYRTKIASLIAFLFSVFLSALDGIMSYFAEAREKLSVVQDFFTDIPSAVWFGAAAAVAFYLWHKSRKAEAEQIAQVRSGESAGPAY